jgi:hypothetical protein
MKRTISTIAATGLGAIALVATGTMPAAASDGYAAAWHNGTRVAVATYDDLTDNLCVRILTDGSRGSASATIYPAGDGRTWTITDRPGGGRSCTGNLAIPEDRRYDLALKWVRYDQVAFGNDAFYS